MGELGEVVGPVEGPRMSNPFLTICFSFSASGSPLAHDTSYHHPNTLPMMLFNTVAWRCRWSRACRGTHRGGRGWGRAWMEEKGLAAVLQVEGMEDAKESRKL